MTINANKGENFDAIACYEEWVVDNVDPQDGDVEFIAPDSRLIEEINPRALGQSVHYWLISAPYGAYYKSQRNSTQCNSLTCRHR